MPSIPSHCIGRAGVSEAAVAMWLARKEAYVGTTYVKAEKRSRLESPSRTPTSGWGVAGGV